MKLNKSLLIMALSLFSVSGVFAEQKAKKDEVPGVAAQPASYFYTGKPYDADLGAYTFNYRNYDPELQRWTSVDPSGFPDGANAYSYVQNSPSGCLDDLGLTTINIPLSGLSFTFSNGSLSFNQELTGSRWKNSTQGDIQVTWSISGTLSLDANAVVAGAKLDVTVSTSAQVTVPKDYSGWAEVSVSFDKSKWNSSNPGAAFSVSWTAKTAE